MTHPHSETAISPELSAAVRTMCLQTFEMLGAVREAFRRQAASLLEAVGPLGREIHAEEKSLTARMTDRPEAAGEFLFVPMHLERIADCIEALAQEIRRMIREAVPLTDRAMNELGALLEKAGDLIECVRDAVETRNRVLLRYLREEGRRLEEMADEGALNHQERLIEGVCMPASSSMYLAMLDSIKGIEDHIRRIGEHLAEPSARPE